MRYTRRITGLSTLLLALATPAAVQANLIVLGHKHLESWAERWWRGASVSQSLIEYAPCSVLIVIQP